MSLQIVTVMDPIASIKTAKDSTFAMLLEAQRRGHRLFYVLPGGLSVVEQRTLEVPWSKGLVEAAWCAAGAGVSVDFSVSMRIGSCAAVAARATTRSEAVAGV